MSTIVLERDQPTKKRLLKTQSSEPALADSAVQHPPPKKRDRLMEQLEVAAKAKSEAMFSIANAEIDWLQRPPDDFILAANYALQAGAHIAARRLSMEGNLQHPGVEELRKLAYVLSPPVTRVERNQACPGIRLNRDWLKNHSHEYRGKWVALQDGKLLGFAETLSELHMRIGTNKTILFTKAL